MGTSVGGLVVCALSDSGTHLAARANAAAAGVMLMLCFLELVPSALAQLGQARAGFCFVVGNSIALSPSSSLPLLPFPPPPSSPSLLSNHSNMLEYPRCSLLPRRANSSLLLFSFFSGAVAGEWAALACAA